MTFDEAFASGEVATSADPSTEVDLGTEGAEQVSAEGTTPEPARLDVDGMADHIVTVKVNGEDVEVPLAELRNGYSRQADYTQSKQALAEERRQLQEAQAIWQALQTNPAEALPILERRFLAEQQAAAEQEGEYDAFEDDEDPRYAALASEVEVLKQERANEQMARYLESLQAKYGDDFDPKVVAAEALRRNNLDIEGVYKSMAFDRIVARQHAAGDFAKQREAEDKQIEAAKGQIANVVTGGGSAAGGGVPAQDFADLQEAIRAAMQVSGFAS